MLDSFQIESASVSDRGLSKKRPQNEDSFLEIPKSGIFAVADGVGGAEAGEVASQMAVEILAEAFVNEAELSDAEEVMRRALEQANAAIHRMSNELPQLASMATTIVALHVAGNIATIGHAGDSRLYRLSPDGRLHRETEDHSMVADEVRAGRMTPEQAENHPGKNIISRALGAEPTVEVDLKTIMVGPDTTFLICSDGVTRHISDLEISTLLRSGATPVVICGRIKDVCFERGAEDNLTAVIVRLTEATAGRDSDAEKRALVDEVTVATPRPAVVVRSAGHDPDQLLELETGELNPPMAAHGFDVAAPNFEDTLEVEWPDPTPASTGESAEREPLTPEPAADKEYETLAAIPIEKQILESPPGKNPGAVADENTVSHEYRSPESRAGIIGKIIGSALLLLIGSLIGLASYHYLLANRTPETVAQPNTEMQSSNQQLTAFEDNRRLVDKDTEAVLKQLINEPKDAENSFLLGRAYLLTGQFPEARVSFTEALKLIADGKVDPHNAKTIQRDISIAMTIINDPLAQKNFKKELGDLKQIATPGANSNR